MMICYLDEGGRLLRTEHEKVDLKQAVWIDLYDPTSAEEALVEEALGIDVPVREEMEEIEISSRLYFEDSAAFMTATLPARTDSDDPLLGPVSFVLAGDRLITVRHHEPRAFQTVPAHASRNTGSAHSGASVLIALLEVQVDRLADVLERAGRDIAQLSREVFRHRASQPTRSADIQSLLESIGRKGDLTANIRECLVSLERMIGFLNDVLRKRGAGKEMGARVRTLARDCQSLTDHAGFLTQKITFLLDATLGLINIEQNAIIKIFSVAAVVFLPPTLIASIYGMNFGFMPELQWPLGYPFALLLMVGSAVLPYWYFKRRGWL